MIEAKRNRKQVHCVFCETMHLQVINPITTAEEAVNTTYKCYEKYVNNLCFANVEDSFADQIFFFFLFAWKT